jgi:protein phosphatase
MRSQNIMNAESHTISTEGRRAHNEDAVLCSSACVDGESITLIAVADGMGGSDGGEVASQIAVEQFQAAWDVFTSRSERVDASAIRVFLKETYAAVNDAVGAEAESTPSLAEMGTTLVAAILTRSRAVVANVGDSRAYLVAQDLVEQISQDHSAVADSIREGIITEVEARNSPYRHALTRSIDGSPGLEVDLFPARGGWMSLPADSMLLLCSDGLTGAVGSAIVYESEIYDYLLGAPDLETSAEKLVTLALERGSRDNISIAVAEVGRVERQGTLPDHAPLFEVDNGQSTEKDDSAPARALALAAALCVVLIGLMGTLAWHLGARPEQFGIGGAAAVLKASGPAEVTDGSNLRGSRSLSWERSKRSSRFTPALPTPEPTSSESPEVSQVQRPNPEVKNSDDSRSTRILLGPVSPEVMRKEYSTFPLFPSIEEVFPTLVPKEHRLKR